MFDWITKPYLEWTHIDRILCGIETIILIFIIFWITVGILELKDIIKRRIKWNNNR